MLRDKRPRCGLVILLTSLFLRFVEHYRCQTVVAVCAMEAAVNRINGKIHLNRDVVGGGNRKEDKPEHDRHDLSRDYFDKSR